MSPILGPGGQPISSTSNPPPTLVNANGDPLTSGGGAAAETETEAAGTEAAEEAAEQAAEAAAKSGWFERIRTAMMFWQEANKVPLGISGLVWLAIPIELAALANIGDPIALYTKGMDWTDHVSRPANSSWQDMLGVYNNEIVPYWAGGAQKTLDTYVTKTLSAAAQAMVNLADQFASAMTAVSVTVAALDISILVLTVASGIWLQNVAGACLALPEAFPLLVKEVEKYLMGVAAWIGGMVSSMVNFGVQLGSLEQKANALRSAVWQDGDVGGASILPLPDALTDPGSINDAYWQMTAAGG